jgi:hypothetical protein
VFVKRLFGVGGFSAFWMTVEFAVPMGAIRVVFQHSTNEFSTPQVMTVSNG